MSQLIQGHFNVGRLSTSGLLMNGRILASALILFYAMVGLAQQSVSVTTQHNDNFRTGWNSNETVLNINSFQNGHFGKLCEFAVDGDIYAQPLLVAGVNIAGKSRNVVYIATMSNTVYALDADALVATADDPGCKRAELWRQSLEKPVVLTKENCGGWDEPEYDFNSNVCAVIQREIGIVSTPVISASINPRVIYVVTFTCDPCTGETRHYVHYLHALDLQTHQELFKRTQIKATGFDSRLQLQRAALLLANDKVYVAFASLGDRPPFRGWIFSFDAKNLALNENDVFKTTTNPGGGGGIWQAGNGLAADDKGDIYLMSGNGDFDHSEKGLGGPYGNSFIKLTSKLKVVDRFTPWNSDHLNDKDLDLGSGGPLLFPLPTNQVLVGAGKEGKLYLLKRDSLGGYSRSEQNESRKIVQSFIVTAKPCPNWNESQFPDNGCGEPSPAFSSQEGHYHVHGSPVFREGAEGLFIYVWGEASYLRRFRFDRNTGRFDLSKTKVSSFTTPTRSMPGAFLSISSNKSFPGQAILWATHPIGCRPEPNSKCSDKRDPKCWCDANNGVFPGDLRAINPDTLTELWNSEKNQKDKLGYCAKFTPPTIANGKVYVATFAEPEPGRGPAKLVVYGCKDNKCQ